MKLLKKKGFTLIELLVVIAIIGTLATIVMVSLNTARSKARDTRRATDLKNIALALEMYYDTNSAYPDALSSLVTTYLAAEPKDPKTAVAYAYNNCGTGNNDYTLGAQLENDNATLEANDIDTATCDLTGLAPATCADLDNRYCLEP